MIHGTFIWAEGQFAFEIEFLSKAVYRNAREFMMYLHVEASESGLLGVATDGRRLHIVDPLSCPEGLGLEPGEWRVLKTAKKYAWIAKVEDKDVARYPAWRRVIPDEEPLYTAQFRGLSLKPGPYDEVTDFVKFIRGFPELTAIQLRYLADLGTADTWAVNYRGKNKAVVFESGNRKAVIQPIWVDG